MATTFQLKRSSVAGKVPNTSTLSIGELGLNLTDQKLYSSNGTGVFELGANLTNLTVGGIKANGSYGTAGQVLTSNGSTIYWTEGSSSGAARIYSVTTVSGTQNTFTTSEQFVSGTIDVYLNGVHLSNSEYAEVNSTAIQLTSDATNGAIVEVSGWVTINTLVAGANTTIQFNDSGFINSSPTFTWNKSSELLTVGNSSVNSTVNSTSISIGSNNLTVGTSAYFVSNGNVGIGTSSPTNDLQVTGIVKATSRLYVGSTSDDLYSGGIENLSNISRSVGINADPTNSGASSIINFKIDGTEFMRLNSSGNLGIGTTSPSGKLHIADTSATYIFTSNSTSSYDTTFNMDNTGLDIGHNSVSRSINFLTGSLDRMTITGTGNVGIGLTTPARKLDIYDSSNTLRNVLGVFNGVTGTSAQNNGVSILLGQSDAGYCAKISTIFESQNPDYLRPALAFFTMGDSYLIGSEVERMRITSAGNVGIGTTAPATILEINSNVTTYWGQTTTNTWGGSLTPPQALTITNRYPSGYDPVMLFRQATSTGTIKTSGAIGMVGAANWLDGTPSSQISSMYFVVRNTTDGLNEVMRMTADGRVGIGTTSPSFKLHVVGDTIVGVYGVSSTNIGVYGQSTSSYGVRGISSTSTGLYGSSTDGVGTYGFSTNNYGLYGQSDTTMGVYGRTNTTSGSGVYAYNSSSGKVCRLAYSTTYGVYTTGDIYTSGALSKGSGSFKIPHPLPELSKTHNLVHSFVEAPTADNIYRGKVQLENGQATVNIDTHVGMTEGTFSALNGNIQVFLQNDSGWDLVRGSVSDNILTIISQNQSSTDTISWMVIGERQDQHMLDTQWTDEFGRPILEPLREPEPDIPLPEVSNENG